MDKAKEMTQEREAAILEGAINKWGNTLHITVAIEELSELQKALCKYQRWAISTEDGEGRAEVVAAIKEEIADVSIMLNQLELIFGDCTEEEISKLERLEKMVGIVPQPDAPTCRWTPEDVQNVKLLHFINPNFDVLFRSPDGKLCAIASPADFPASIRIEESLFGNLWPGQFVRLADIIGGGEGGNGK